ncbi:putative hydrolase of the HAD superfamily [Gracilibacillus halotolerans]|uniref:Putative hydrolase of the HAD superfamily n=1 Tax=Gracilibacillus halotolerans TaxID=74386 RepID=A0A841RLH7_9BACI|nr:HAD family hydrolase [Gracilibacillus halotolerans]MBB6512473.1 putative hydrolase of the HAD superfamily [Gracilibacillus halotolerans]
MQTIVFDLDDTLYNQLDPFRIATNKILPVTFTDQEMEEFYLVSRKYSDEVFEAQMKGEITALELQTYRIMMACKDFGCPIDQETAHKFQNEYVFQQRQIKPFQEVEILLSQLKNAGKQLAILTNGEYYHQLMKIQQLKLHRWIPEENFFISGALGVSKPDTQVFDIVEEKLKAKKDTMVYIGDSFQNDVIGAKQSGWKVIWFNHRRHPQPTTSISPDAIIEHPEELLEYFSSKEKSANR